MDLYLIRHAEAADIDEKTNGTDDERPLTDKGREQARQLAAAFLKRGIRPTVFVTSPLVRARQTTDELVAALGEPAPEVEVFDEIGLSVRPRKVAKHLRRWKGNESIAVVAHQPGMSRFAAWLIGSKKAQLDIGKAGFYHMQCDRIAKNESTLVGLVNIEWYA